MTTLIPGSLHEQVAVRLQDRRRFVASQQRDHRCRRHVQCFIENAPDQWTELPMGLFGLGWLDNLSEKFWPPDRADYVGFDREGQPWLEFSYISMADPRPLRRRATFDLRLGRWRIARLRDF